MEKDTQQDNPAPREVREHFDTTLARHLERLVGTSVGIGALSLNLETISCLVLLGERESEIANFPSSPPERHTNHTFFGKLAEIGLESDENLKAVLQQMIQKGYVRVDSNGRFLAEKPAISMVQLLDRLFPAMPGMNLVAFLVQMMDEVLSGRKDLESAIDQFDQTLQMQGVSPSKEKHRPGTRRIPVKDKEQPTLKKSLKLSETYRRRRAEARPSPPLVSSCETKIVSASGEVSQFEVRDLFCKGEESLELTEHTREGFEFDEPEVSEEATEPEPEGRLTELPSSLDTEVSCEEPEVPVETAQEGSREPDSEEPDLSKETVSRNTALEDIPSDQQMGFPVSEPVTQDTGPSRDKEVKQPEKEADETGETASTAETLHEKDLVSEACETIRSDDLVERRFADFQKDLAMVCPVCTTGRVKAERTAKGKLFHQCSNKSCVFVSWGKPYHIPCPQCRNPFLIESAERDGKRILRCPRATCHHRQRLPGETSGSPFQNGLSMSEEATRSSIISRRPRRKAVRRRLVRRKRNP